MRFRPIRELPVTVALLSTFFCVAYHPVITNREALFPADVLVGHTGFRHVHGQPSVEMVNGVLTDPVFQIYPWRALAREQIRAGELPLWNPFSGLGVPLLGNFQSAPFDVTGVPFLLDPKPARGWTWTCFVRMMLAGTGLYLLARRVGASRAGARVAALGYAFAGTTGTMIHWQNSAVAAWFPFELLAAEALVRRPTLGRTLWLALTMLLSILGGHPEVLLVTQGATFLWVLLRRPLHPARMRIGAHGAVIGRFFFASLLALAWGAPVLVPGIEYVLETSRVGHLGGSHAIGMNSYPLATLFAFVCPDLLGDSVDYAGPRNTVWMHAAFVGSSGLLLALAALVRRRLRPIAWFVLAATALAVSIAWITPMNGIVGRVPVLAMCPLYHFSVAANLGLSLLAALGATALIAAPRRARWAMLGGVALASACVAGGLSARPGLADAAYVDATLIRLALPAGLALVCALATLWFRGRVLGLIVVVAVAGELWIVQREYRGTDPARWVYPTARWPDAVRAASGDAAPGRVVGVSEGGERILTGLLPNLGAVYGIANAGTCDPMYPAEFAWLMRRIGSSTPSPLYLRPEAGRASALDFLGVQCVAVPDAWPGFDFRETLAFDGFRSELLPEGFAPIDGDGVARTPAPGVVDLPLDARAGQLRAVVRGEGAGGRVTVSVARSPRERRVFARYLDPRRRELDRGWIPVSCDLRMFRGLRVWITVHATNGPDRDNACDAVVFADTRLGGTPLSAGRGDLVRFRQRVAGQIAWMDVALGGVTRSSLVLHAPAAIAWTCVVPDADTRLDALVGVALPSLDARGDGALVEIRVRPVSPFREVASIEVGDESKAFAIDLPDPGARQRTWLRLRSESSSSRSAIRWEQLRLDTRSGAPAAREGGLAVYPRTPAVPRAFVAYGARPDRDKFETRALLTFDDADHAPFIEGLTAPVNSRGQDPTPATVVKYRATRVAIDVRAERPGWLVLRESFYPGWIAKVDGEPTEIVRANRVFRAVRVPAGDHRVVFRYRPASWRLSLWATGGATLLVGFVVLVRGRRRRRP